MELDAEGGWGAGGLKVRVGMGNSGCGGLAVAVGMAGLLFIDVGVHFISTTFCGRGRGNGSWRWDPGRAGRYGVMQVAVESAIVVVLGIELACIQSGTASCIDLLQRR